MQRPNFGTLTPKIVLGIAAHPDDLDFSAAGTLALFAKQGAEVHYLLLTDGSKGTADENVTQQEVIATRQEEQRDACQAIGGKQVHFLSYCDGELEATRQLKADIVKTIRALKPDTVVIVFDPSMIYAAEYGMVNHPDHRVAGQAALDAVYPLARDHLALPELLAQGFKPHKVATVLLVNFNEQNYHVDITDTLDTKMAAIEAHVSQISDLPSLQQTFVDMARVTGAECGCDYAEGFVRIDVMR